MEQKESWLDVVTSENIKELRDILGLGSSDKLKIAKLPNGEKSLFLQGLTYGTRQFKYAYYILKGLEVLYLNSSSSSEFTVVSNDIITADSPKDFKPTYDDILANNWFKYLAKINSGRKINGQTFEEALSELIHKRVTEYNNIITERANDYLNGIFNTNSVNNKRKK